jgi:hypothetical protein
MDSSTVRENIMIRILKVRWIEVMGNFYYFFSHLGQNENGDSMTAVQAEKHMA